MALLVRAVWRQCEGRIWWNSEVSLINWEDCKRIPATMRIIATTVRAAADGRRQTANADGGRRVLATQTINTTIGAMPRSYPPSTTTYQANIRKNAVVFIFLLVGRLLARRGRQKRKIGKITKNATHLFEALARAPPRRHRTAAAAEGSRQ